ncbi:MAG: ABC transporter substrate-binding protein [Anaerolineae bacterium]
MSFALLPALSAYIPRDRVESILRPGYPLARDGVALIADISGFTPLTEALTHGLSPDQGAEELTRALDGVFTPLIEQIHAFRGSVIKFGGDALIVWYGREPRARRAALVRRAVTSAWRMQQAIKVHGQVPTPIGLVTLKMKVGLTYGPVKRFNLGRPEHGYEDVLGGRTLDRMAEAEHQAEPGQIILDADTLAQAPGILSAAGWRGEFAVLGQLRRPARPKPWPPLRWPPQDEGTLTERLIPYVPPVIHQTLASGRAQVAELKPVVSLFIQFHGIDYDTDPDVGEKLQTYFATAQQVVGRYGGRLNRLITGDKGSLIHVIFGAPRTVEEQEARAVRCALDLQAACGGLPFIGMQRIGLTVGRVFAGPVGSPDRHDYTTMGDSINLSARLMQHAADDQILLEAAVRSRLGPEFEVADLGQITVKGKSEPISVFAATGLQAEAARPDRKRAPGRAMPLFGRDEEMNLLQKRLARLAAGQGGLITLVGEVGLGKTHILASLRSGLDASLTWADGVCLAYGQTLSGYLFIDLLRDLLELPPGAAPEETSQHLLDFCAGLFGPARLDATYPYLARFMGLPLGGEYAQRLEGLAGESLRWQLFEIIQEMLVLLAQRRPLVLALDDLQWADPTSLQLVESILPLAAEQPVLLLLSMRPERDRKAWTLRRHALEQEPGRGLDLTLNGLEREPATALIAHYAPGLPDRIVAYLVEKGGGNPLFLVEIVRTLQAQGLLDGQVDLARVEIDALALPDSVQGLLLAQIDRLAVEARHTLQMASVIGKNFLYKVLDALAAGEKHLSERLAALEADEFILPDDPTDLGLAYTFRHILIQESAYGTLLYKRRRAYHRQVAQTLERLFPALIGEQAGLLGFHYERAEDLDQAIYYHLQAADQARLLYANEEAEALYRQVLALIDRLEADFQPDLERRAKTFLKIAQVRANALDFEGAQEFYDLAFELLEQVERARPPQAEPAHDEERLIRLGVLEHGPTTLDPGLSEIEDVSEIIKDLFEGLVELDTELNVIPALARRWQIYDGGNRYRFELRRNLKWSDGAPLTAHDFVFAWRRNLDPKTGAGLAYQLYGVRGAEAFHQGQTTDPDSVAIKALDDFNLEITLNVPTGYFPYLLDASITFPQPAHQIRARGNDWSKPEHLVCNGPFKIARWKQDEEICLVKNPRYRGFSQGNLEKARLFFIEPSLDHYLAGKIDWCRVEDRSDLPARYPQEALLTQYLQTFLLGFSCSHPPFDQKAIRQAFAASIDQKTLAKEVWSNVQKPAMGGVIPPGMPGHSPEIGLRFDPAAARNLLNKDGSFPRLTLAASGGFNTTPQFLQETWRAHLGLDVDLIEDMPTDEILSNLSAGSVQIALIGWDVEYPDPDSVLRTLFHGDSPINYFGWRNERFDRLVEQAAGSTDQQERLALYHQADRILVAEDAAVVPLYYYQAYGLLAPRFRIEGSGKIIRGGKFKLKNIVVS